MGKRKAMVRLGIEMNEETSDKLEKMADELETSRVGVIRHALATLEIIMNERKRGKRVGFARSADSFDDELDVA